MKGKLIDGTNELITDYPNESPRIFDFKGDFIVDANGNIIMPNDLWLKIRGKLEQFNGFIKRGTDELLLENERLERVRLRYNELLKVSTTKNKILNKFLEESHTELENDDNNDDSAVVDFLLGKAIYCIKELKEIK